ncbi:MAG: class I SAM-dependent methyltransferase [Nitrospina sp.]|nr:class I SAM-dependent methyltransferase [Nitrospina sp.]MBT6600494.1 class I SAM-dependent methyltransferase [Nitrospina sp.]
MINKLKTFEPSLTREKVLEENKRVHKLENHFYLDRHPEQTNFYQSRIVRKTVDQVCSLLNSKNSDILELGCGTGYLYLEFLKRGYKITGVDISSDMIRVLEEKIQENDKKSSRLVVNDVETFANIDKKKYSAIIISALLHHLYDFESVIKMYCERLMPGGVFLIFFEPLKQKINSTIRYSIHQTLAGIDETIYRRKMMRQRISILDGEYHDADYQRQFGGIDPYRIIDLFTKEGLKTLQIEKYCARRFGLSSFLATRLLKTQNTFNLLAKK